MKKLLLVLGGIFGLLIVAGLIGFSYLIVEGGALDEESRAYVDEVTPKLLADLRKETLFRYASDELKMSSKAVFLAASLKISTEEPPPGT